MYAYMHKAVGERVWRGGTAGAGVSSEAARLWKEGEAGRGEGGPGSVCSEAATGTQFISQASLCPATSITRDHCHHEGEAGLCRARIAAGLGQHGESQGGGRLAGWTEIRTGRSRP